MALKQRHPKPGLVHHSDRGIQYASTHYTGLLGQHGIRISMSRTGNPYDNAKAESFIKTLKYEEVYRQEYRDLAEARSSIGRFLEDIQPEATSLGTRLPTAGGVRRLFARREGRGSGQGSALWKAWGNLFRGRANRRAGSDSRVTPSPASE